MIGSPHWTISATGWFEKRRKLQDLRHYFASGDRSGSSGKRHRTPFRIHASRC